jgi:hypothetical protein
MCVGDSVWLGWSCIHVAGFSLDTTPTQPHRNSNTHRTKNNTTNVAIQKNSRKLLKMDILMSETCWTYKKWNKIASDIKLVFYFSTSTNSCFIISLLYASTWSGYKLLVCGCFPTWKGGNYCQWPRKQDNTQLVAFTDTERLRIQQRTKWTWTPITQFLCDDTICCIIQFWPPDDQYIVLETCRGMQ